MDNRNYPHNSTQERDRDNRYTRDDEPGTARTARHSNPGNFANNHEKAVEAGRKGGQNSHNGRHAPSHIRDEA